MKMHKITRRPFSFFRVQCPLQLQTPPSENWAYFQNRSNRFFSFLRRRSKKKLSVTNGRNERNRLFIHFISFSVVYLFTPVKMKVVGSRFMVSDNTSLMIASQRLTFNERLVGRLLSASFVGSSFSFCMKQHSSFQRTIH